MNEIVLCVSTQMCNIIKKGVCEFLSNSSSFAQLLHYKYTLLSSSSMNFGQPPILKVPDQHLMSAKEEKILSDSLKVSGVRTLNEPCVQHKLI